VLVPSCQPLGQPLGRSTHPQAMFGTTEGPWNMTKRLEAKVGSRLIVDAIIEVDPPRAEAALKLKAESPSAKYYEKTVILPDVKAFVDKVNKGEIVKPT